MDFGVPPVTLGSPVQTTHCALPLGHVEVVTLLRFVSSSLTMNEPAGI